MIDIREYAYTQGEDCVLSYLLQDKQVDTIISGIPEHFFYNEARHKIFTLCRSYSVHAGQGSVNYRAICDKITQLGKSTVLPYLDKLYKKDLREYPELEYVRNKLKDMAIRRQLLSGLGKRLADIKDVNKDVSKTMADIEEDISQIERREKGTLEIVTADQIIPRRYDGIKKRYRSNGYYTGWEIMDRRLSVGFAPGKISVIAGRTSMGKSFFKTNLIISMAQQGIGIMNVCPEQGFDSEHDRLDSILTGIHLNDIIKLRKWKPNDLRFQQLKSASETIQNWNYVNVPNRKLSVSQIRTALRRARRSGFGTNVVFIDLFDRLDDVNVARDRAGTISVKLGEIERIAEEEDVHICLLVQINRTVESRKNKRPTMAELRDCGNFEQDADLVMLLYREGYYDDTVDDNILEVKIEKQRDGVSGIWFQFLITDPQVLSIVPMAEREKISDKD